MIEVLIGLGIVIGVLWTMLSIWACIDPSDFDDLPWWGALLVYLPVILFTLGLLGAICYAIGHSITSGGN